MKIKAIVIEPKLDLAKKNEEVSIVNIEGMRCTVVNSVGVLFNLRFTELKVTDKDFLPLKSKVDKK